MQSERDETARAASPIQFYLPIRPEARPELPSASAGYWSWVVENRDLGEGRYSWTLQTFLLLRERGFPCLLTHRFPRSGIVVSHRDFLPVFLRPRPRVFLVCIKPDRKPHTWAQHHIVQNERDGHALSKGGDGITVLPFWPQPSLKPREVGRGTRCENVAYFGRPLNLARELRGEGWLRELSARDFNWLAPPLPTWNDYSAIDVTVSVRTFDSGSGPPNPTMDADSKPPSKLINSWLAGVPALVGRESAYQHIRESPLDFIEVASPPEILAALERLRLNPTLYQDMIAHGFERSQRYSVPATCRRWENALTGDICTASRRWDARSIVSQCFGESRAILKYFADVRNWKDLASITRRKS